MSIYESYYDTMIQIMEHIAHQLEANSRRYETEHGDKLYEHINYRIKGDESMRDKLVKRGLAPTAYNPSLPVYKREPECGRTAVLAKQGEKATIVKEEQI
jgi:ppGpp synthetase/RelA/SpoT-type nucleotidyltranferase